MINEQFNWQPQPEAEKFIDEQLKIFISKNQAIYELEKKLIRQTSTRLFDWIDHIALNFDEKIEKALVKVGFQYEGNHSHGAVYMHPGAQLPRVVLFQNKQQSGVAVSVDSISDFLLIHGLSKNIEGSPYSRFRSSLIHHENNVCLWVVERRGTTAVEPIVEDKDYLMTYHRATEMWASRPRSLQDEELALEETLKTAKQLTKLIDKDLAACIVLERERHYWEAKNRAGQIQKDRQDSLGMGWANHDHHTFRSSRKHFKKLVYLFELLGFHCRERFYAGKEAGWGAQVMENPRSKLVLFLDVDLDTDEIAIDFAHQDLPELPKLGTIGLWCALHGDSILKSGMHHLEAQFLFDDLKKDLLEKGVRMMDPFSNFDYLKQAFTAGEIWDVDKSKVDQLLKGGKISQENADKFLSCGAVGSHLENLQRREGYKGFNQKNVSVIIKETDPRKI